MTIMNDKMLKLLRNRDFLFSLFFFCACVALLFVDINIPMRGLAQAELHHDRGRVLSVDDRFVRRDVMILTGEERLQVELTGGRHEGVQLLAVNMLTGQMSIDEIYKPGDSVLVQYALDASGKPIQGVARGHYRVSGTLWIFALFVVLIIAVSGSTGAKAVLSFVFAALLIWKVMIPLYLLGKDPLLVGMGVMLLLAFCICFLVGGLNRRGLTAFIGTILGLGVTLTLAMSCTNLFHINGAVRHYSETLLYSGYPELRLTPIFIASIVVGCSGAVMDLAMDIASAMEEIKVQNPAITAWGHIKSGLSVGRAVTGTMTTTLLLAYSSSSIAMLMLFYSHGLPLERMININDVSAEFLNIIVGSFGAVSVAPFTAFVGGYIFRKAAKQAS
jgi:uncharacterized membrane protein